MTNAEEHSVSREQWARRLETVDAPLPAGFAFFTMRKITLERMRRAELSARWQAASLAVATCMLLTLCLLSLSQFGFNQSAWLASIPWVELIVTVGLIVAFLLLDMMLARRFDASAD